MRDSRHYLFSVACSGMLVFGMILALPGTVIGLPEFIARFNLSLADRGIFIAVLFGALLAGSVLSGPMVDRVGYRLSIAGSAAVIASLLPAFALATSYRLVLLTLGGLGLSSATLNTAANALSSDLFPEERGRRMTMIAVAFSIGGLLLPTTIAAAAHLVPWRTVVIWGGVLSAATFIAALLAAFPHSAAHGTPGSALRQLLGQPSLLRFCLLIACAAANEGAFAGWTSSYLSASGFDAVGATWGLSSHWLGLLVGRLTFATRVDRAKRAAITRGGAAGALILLALIVAPIRPVLVLGPFAAGVAIAVVVPTALALAGERYPANAGTLFGLLLTMAQVGGMTLPPVIGAVADVTSLRMALLLAVANGFFIGWLAGTAGAGESNRSSRLPKEGS